MLSFITVLTKTKILAGNAPLRIWMQAAEKNNLLFHILKKQSINIFGRGFIEYRSLV